MQAAYLRIRSIRSEGLLKNQHISFSLQSEDTSNATTIRCPFLSEGDTCGVGITFSLLPSDDRKFVVEIKGKDLSTAFKTKVKGRAAIPIKDMPGYLKPVCGKEFTFPFQMPNSVYIELVLVWNFIGKDQNDWLYLCNYSREFEVMAKAGENHLVVNVRHNFLNLVDELELLRETFHSDQWNLAMVLKIGKESTQVYRRDRAIGAYFFGLNDFLTKPSITADLLRQSLLTIGRADEQAINAPIIIVIDSCYPCGSSSVDINAIPIEQAIPEKFQPIVSTCKDTLDEMRFGGACIVPSLVDRRGIDADWMDIMAERLGEVYSNGFYIGDFGGSEIRLKFYRTGLSPCSRKGVIDLESVPFGDESAYELGFINDMIDGRFYTSQLFSKVVKTLRSRIIDHALQNGVSKIFCEIFQTGLSRRQHFLGNTDPNAFNQVDFLADDVLLESYGKELKRRIELPLFTPLPPSAPPSTAPFSSLSSSALSSLTDLQPTSRTTLALSQAIHGHGSTVACVADSTVASIADHMVASVSDSSEAAVADSIVAPIADPTVASVSDSSLITVADSTVAPMALESHPDSWVSVHHSFLRPRDEAELERHALFSREGIDHVINGFLQTTMMHSRIEYKPDNTHVAIIVSIGTAMCQVFTKECTIGSFYAGTDTIQDPQTAKKIMQDIIEEVKRLKINAPIIVIGSITYWVKKSVLFGTMHPPPQRYIEASLNDADFADEAAKQRSVQVLLGISEACKEYNAGCILKAKGDEPRIKGGWLKVLCNRFGASIVQGSYFVDFGGIGPGLFYFKPSVQSAGGAGSQRGAGTMSGGASATVGSAGGADADASCDSFGRLSDVSAELEEVKKDRSLRSGQPQFVREMMRGAYDSSEGFCNAVTFLREQISQHAREHGVEPIVCKIFQTGLARQQHFHATTQMHVMAKMMVFTEDTHLLRYSRELSARLADQSIESEHQFLRPSDEADMERQAVFEREEYREKNKDNINSLLTEFASGEAIHEIDPTNPDMVIIASIGTASTQVFTRNKLLCTFYLGTEAMLRNEDFARIVLEKIICVARQGKLSLPIILINSIGFFVTKTADLSSKTTDVKHIVEHDVIEESRAKVLEAFKKVCEERRSELNNQPVILKAKEDVRKILGDWIDVVADRLLRQYPVGCFIVDFGGGGPDVRFCSSSAAGARKINSGKPHRGIREHQREFVKEMKCCEYQTSFHFNSITDYLQHEILTYAREHNVSPIVCKIFQTGLARQQHMKGHVGDIVEIEEPLESAPREIRVRIVEDSLADRSDIYTDWYRVKMYLQSLGRPQTQTVTKQKGLLHDEFVLTTEDYRLDWLCVELTSAWLWNRNLVGSIKPISLTKFNFGSEDIPLLQFYADDHYQDVSGDSGGRLLILSGKGGAGGARKTGSLTLRVTM